MVSEPSPMTESSSSLFSSSTETFSYEGNFGGYGDPKRLRGNYPGVICHKINHTGRECSKRLQAYFKPWPLYFDGFSHVNQGQPFMKEQRVAYLSQEAHSASSSQPSTFNAKGELTAESCHDNAWYLDSGATHHLTHSIDMLQFSRPYEGNNRLLVGNGQGLIISYIGDFCFHSSLGHNLHLVDPICSTY